MAIRTPLKILAWAFIAGGVVIAVTGISWIHAIVFVLLGSAALKFVVPSIEKMDRETEELHRQIIVQMEMQHRIAAETKAMLDEAQQEFQEFIKRMREQGLAT